MKAEGPSSCRLGRALQRRVEREIKHTAIVVIENDDNSRNSLMSLDASLKAGSTSNATTETDNCFLLCLLQPRDQLLRQVFFRLRPQHASADPAILLDRGGERYQLGDVGAQMILHRGRKALGFIHER